MTGSVGWFKFVEYAAAYCPTVLEKCNTQIYK